MNKSYLNSVIKIISSSKPSTTIRLLLMVLFVSSFANAQTNTWDGSSSTAWATGANWSLGHAPTSAEDVVIGNFVPGSYPTLSTNTTVKSLTINGRSATGSTRGGDLTINTGITLTITNDLIMNGSTGGGTAGNVRIAASGTASISVGGNVTTNNSTGGPPEEPKIVMGSGTFTVTGNLAFSSNTTFTAGTSTVVFNAATGTQTINNATLDNFNNITKSGAATLQLLSNVPIVGNLNVSAGTLDLSTFTANRTAAGGTLTVAGTLLIGGTNNFPTNFTTFTNTGGTVNYDNTGAQTVAAKPYNNLILSGSGTKTFGAATTITNNFSITSGVIANLGTGLTHTAGVLTLGGQGTVPGSWGSTSSSAINKDNTYFAATTGIVNNNCVAPAAPTGSAVQLFCSSASPKVSNLSATGTTIKWYSASSGGSALATTTTLVNGTHYYATQTNASGCESSSRFDVTVTVNTTPTITPNKVDETCPVSNNGTITPTISGGLTNIRYIKLTQKYADWQQVAEIQAFQIFTGTNVALASNGATATSSSNYSNDSANYGPQKAIDGDYTNYSFWHSNSTSINEYIRVDLQSGKNLDYLRIHNRVDCCQQRGQNMLLELFDASNNLVYSKTIDLWEGVNGAHYIDVNVLDVSWADSATTLNRTALDSGTYTLNYADAVGCSASSPIVVGSINPTTVGGTVSGGSTPICQGSSTGTLTLSGQVGTVVQWDKRLNSGAWGYAGGSATTFSEIPYAAGTWEYRALVQSGSCTSAYSSIQTIVVSPTPVGGGIYTGNTPICINSSTGAMNLTGYTGSVVRWEKRLLPSATWTTIANTTATYSESPSVGGTWEYRAVVGSGSCTTVNSAAFSVTVNPELTIALTNSNAAICQTTTTASFAYSATTGSPNSWVIDFDAAANTAGMSDQNNGVGASGTITVNVPYSIAAGVYSGNLTVITYYPSCSSVSYPITVTVGVATPTVGTTTQPNCSTSTGSVVLSNLPASGTIYQTGTVITNYPITGTTMTISGLAAGTYNFSASNGTCTSSTTGNVVINAVVTNTWNGTAWSSGTPTSSQALIFSGNYPPSPDPNVDISGCSCTISSGANVTIKTGHNLIITNGVTVSGTGTLTFEDTSSLVQINNAAVNTGSITYNRKTSSVFNTDYTYWSSPVASQTLNISPSYTSGMFYSYNDFAVPEDWKKESASTVMLVGKGYIIRGPQISSPPPPPGFYNAAFVGIPNNGTKTIAIGPSGTSNLLGNPYPSAIDADTFLSTNSSLVEGTIYFWTHNTAIQLASNITNGTAGTGVFAYTSDDYASYNGTGGVAASGGVTPTGKIAAGQAFFTTSKATGTLVTFNNAMRIAGTTLADLTGINQQFFKTKNSKAISTSAIEKNRVWLNMTNSGGAFKQTLIGYITDATNDYDSRFDGETFDGNEFVDFYSVNQGKNLVIQGRALPFDENDIVPLGFKSTIDGDFTIKIDQADGLLANQSVFIEDKLTNTIVDLKTGNYTFNTVAGTFNDRLVLRYSNKTLGTGDFDVANNKVVVSVKNKQIKINSVIEPIDKIIIYDLSGKLIYQKKNISANEFLVADFILDHQTFIVKTILQNGTTVSDKVIY